MEAGFGFGSNLGDRVENIRAAMTALFETPGIDFRAASSFYETPPWGVTDQPAFVNACAVAGTTLDARALLKRVKAIEDELGRVEAERWGPRLIDVDILYLGGGEVRQHDLAIPHRELFNRAFVLVPLAEIRPNLILSGRAVSVEKEHFSVDVMPVVAPPWKP